MATTNKETNNYNMDSAKKNASTGTLIGSGNVDLKNYGIDYSQQQRDEIAGIFANEATKAYGSAQNEYANQMAQQQASLQDTIRRSQAQAVATGASRGMQAANELSSMLGLQEQAAQGATTLQGDYATALANAQKSAMDIQNARAQIGAEMAAADIAGEAQKYSVGMDYQANDPYRVISEIAALRASGDNAAADALLTNWMKSSGATDEQLQGIKDAQHANVAIANNANSVIANSFKPGAPADVNIGDSKFHLTLGTLVDPESELGQAAKDFQNGTAFAYYNKKSGVYELYMKSDTGVRKLIGESNASDASKSNAAAIRAAIDAGNVIY